MQYGDEKGKVFVGGLSWDTTHGSMLKYFSRYGEVIDCVVMKNPATGKSRGFGFVTFKDPSCVETVLASGPHVLDSRQIDPKSCNPRSMNKGGKSSENLKRKIFIGGLPANCNEDLLKEFFGKYGNVTDVVIMYDQLKQRSRGFGFLTFENEESVDRVVSEHYVHINGKQVECKKAEPRDIKAADGTTLDFAGFPGALTLMQSPFSANALAFNAQGLSAAGLSAAAAAGSVPSIYQPMQALSQPVHQNSPYISVPGVNYAGLNPTGGAGITYGAGWPHAAANPNGELSPSLTPSPNTSQAASPFAAQVPTHLYNQLANTSLASPFALAAAGQQGDISGMMCGYAQDGTSFGQARAIAAAVGANHGSQSQSANISFSPNVTYTLAPHGIAPMQGGYGIGAGNGFAGTSLFTGIYTGQGDAPTASYMAQPSPAIGRIPTNHASAAQFHPYRR